MKLWGSVIYVTSAFYSFKGSLLSTLDSLLLCFYHNPRERTLQDGIFHKKSWIISGKMSMDKSTVNVLY